MTVAAVKVENTEERKDTMEKVEESRRHQTEAAIVRVMKYISIFKISKFLDNGKLWITII
jgi:hypothetical protein